jgi:hypothetical protein
MRPSVDFFLPHSFYNIKVLSAFGIREFAGEILSEPVTKILI